MDAHDLLRDANEAIAEMQLLLDLPDDVLGRVAPEVSDWSMAQQLEHVLRSNRSIALAMVRAVDAPSDGGLTESGQRVLDGGAIPRGVGQAPASMRATEAVDLAKLRATWRKMAARYAAMDTSGMDAVQGRVAHQYFGHLTPVEWLRFVGVHTRHHLAIAQDIRASQPDAP